MPLSRIKVDIHKVLTEEVAVNGRVNLSSVLAVPPMVTVKPIWIKHTFPITRYRAKAVVGLVAVIDPEAVYVGDHVVKVAGNPELKMPSIRVATPSMVAELVRIESAYAIKSGRKDS